ncbi:MAG TPA: dienelactone hydrolase family protein [Alphaproteobacteria bacterium]|nr:dienelactone hydrolase family protein [Alphaproteobacteria bacterium]
MATAVHAGKTLTLTTSDGHQLGAYRADPAGTPRGAVVILQEIFGVNDHIRDVCDGYAKDGYVAIAPALFDRVERNLELGYDAADLDRGKKARMQLKWDTALLDVEAAAKAVRSAGKVGVVGYCYGGSVAWLCATRGDFIDAAVCYYGNNIAEFSGEKPKVPVIIHSGSEDHNITREKAEIVMKARPEVPYYLYEGVGHGFNCDKRADYDKVAGPLARQRSIDFLRKHIG